MFKTSPLLPHILLLLRKSKWKPSHSPSRQKPHGHQIPSEKIKGKRNGDGVRCYLGLPIHETKVTKNSLRPSFFCSWAKDAKVWVKVELIVAFVDSHTFKWKDQMFAKKLPWPSLSLLFLCSHLTNLSSWFVKTQESVFSLGCHNLPPTPRESHAWSASALAVTSHRHYFGVHMNKRVLPNSVM